MENNIANQPVDLNKTNVDKMFGNVSDDNLDNAGAPTPDGSNDPKDITNPDAEVNEYGEKDWEKIAKQFQSNYDKTKAEYDKINSQVQELSGVADFVNQLYDDKEVRQAFIAELEPDLVKPKDLHSFIQEGLAKEFGEDFVPDPDEERRYGSKSWLYTKRAEELYDEHKKGSNKAPETLKSLRQKRLESQKAEQEKIQQEKYNIMTKMKWNDDNYDGFLNWASKLRAEDLANIYSSTSKNVKDSGANPPSPVGMPGAVVSDSAYETHLKKMFG